MNPQRPPAPPPTSPFPPAPTRRHFLRGLGTLVALPVLDSLLPASTLRAAEKLADAGGAAATAARGTHALRTAFLYVPNGVNVRHWWPTGAGAGYALSSSLAALTPFRDDLTIFRGLAHAKARANGDGPGDHARATATFLTGAQPRKTSGSDIRVGQSFDQMLAERLGARYRVPSLELSCDPPRASGECDSGYSCAYQFNLSWRSERQPMPAERNPRLVFDRLFGNGVVDQMTESAGRRRAYQQSVLDFVLDDARALQRRLGAADHAKLDEYLTSVREIERRVQTFAAFSATRPPDQPMPAGVPDDYEEHMRLMLDLVVLAFQTQGTPVATLMLAHDGSNRTFPGLGITEGHHSLSHHERREDKLTQIRRIDEFYARQLAYVLGRMKSIREGEGTLLDNTLLLYGSGIQDGDRHDHSNLPVILAGRAGGAVTTGRLHEVGRDVPMTNLYRTIADLHGAPLDRIGDSSGKLALG